MKKSIITHVGIIVAMFAIACAYLSPALGGKVIRQGDIQKADAMSYQQRKVKEQTGTVPNWTSSMFSGMPGYQIASEQPKSVFQPIRNALIMRPLGLERNIAVIFLYLLGFYVAMLALGASPWLALVGAVGFGLGSYNIIIIEAGHITKAWALSMMAPILAGMVLTLRSAVDTSLDKQKRTRRVLGGVLLFTLALILQISFNHIQITFYTVIACVCVGLAYLVSAIVNRRFAPFALKVGLLVVGAALAFGSNARLLLVNEEYARYTMRGGNELTVTPADLYQNEPVAAPQNTSNGLDINYAFSWSYGIGETYTILVPGALGGGSGEKVSTESSFYKSFRATQAPLYWGEQPFTSGPVYFGAIIVLLFFIGLIVVRGPERWWLLAATIIAILMSWGNNLLGLNGWLFNHVPFYNKLRTPSMALVLANVCMAIMAVLTLKAVFDPQRDRKRVNLGLYIGTGVLCVLIIGVLIASGSFSFSGASDRQMAAQYGAQWDGILAVLVNDRAALLRSDSWRSIIFMVLAAAALWLYNNDKIRKEGIVVGIVGLLVLIDLWGVDRRYLDESNFAEKRQLELRRDQWDYDIDELASRYGDQDYRVLNLAVNTYNDSKPSAFHNQIGGYSAAKLSRYQNLIDFYLSRHINPAVLNMLNTRYIVMQNGQVQRNPEALGNAWFVKQIKWVADANGEILALNTIDPATTAVLTDEIVNSDMLKSLGKSVVVDEDTIIALAAESDTSATITMEHKVPYNPDYLKYSTNSRVDQLAVFSEVYYAPDWRAYIDGKPAEYFRANYLLRAMVIPSGTHVIEFKNEAPRFHKLDRINLVVSIATILILVGAVVWVYRKPRKEKA